MELSRVAKSAWLPPTAIAFAAGFWALAGQFIVNRIVFFYIANSEYTAATIIALHLGGFWIGATLARHYKPDAGSLMLATLLATALAEVFTWHLGAIAMGLPVTIALAAIFGIALAALSGALIIHLMQTEKHGHRIIIADTAGSVAGAITGGFVLLPLFGIHHSFGVLLLVQAGVWLAYTLGGKTANRTREAVAMVLAVAAAHVGLPGAVSKAEHVIAVDGMPVEERNNDGSTLMFSARSPYGLVSVIAIDEKLQLNIDGRPLCATRNGWRSVNDIDRSTWMIGAYPAKQAGKSTGARMANIGLGCGVTMAALLSESAPDARIDVVEINPAMPAAQRLFNGSLPYTQADPRINLIIEDGFRHFATYDGPPYDVVAIDVAWMQNMNATHLFALEMYQNIKAHLKPEGVLGVWIEETNPLSATALIIYRTLKEVFPYVVVDVNHGSVVFYASPARADLVNDLPPESRRMSEYMPDSTTFVPVNRLDSLVMNRTKFDWWGDSRWERLLAKYRAMHTRYWTP